MTKSLPPTTFERLVKTQEKADTLWSLGRLREAVKIYEEIARIDPHWGNGWIFMRIGDIHEDLGDLDSAEIFFTQSVARNADPPNPLYRLNHAAFLLERGKADAAISFLFDALQVAVDQGATAIVPQVRDRIAEAAPKTTLSPSQIDQTVDGILRGTLRA